MIKELLITVTSEHAHNIYHAQKKHELRNWIPKDYKGWVYVYVSTSTAFIGQTGNMGKAYFFANHKGKIPYRFWFEEYRQISHEDVFIVYADDLTEYTKSGNKMYLFSKENLDELNLSYNDILRYCNGNDLFVWHIDKLEKFDQPKELSDFQIKHERTLIGPGNPNFSYTTLTKAPIKMIYVYRSVDDENEKNKSK